MNTPNYIKGLNEAQKRAVLHTEGPLLIVAGAGAGKTKTLTHRIAHLISTGVQANRILAVTFTNKAAGEMRERIEKLLQGLETGGRHPYISTFHSLGVRLLREFSGEAGLARSFVIWDRDDSIRALKKILEALGLDAYTPRQILSRISREKGEGVSVREFGERVEKPYDRAVASAWAAYEKRLAEEDALDFDDLLFRTLMLLKKPDIAKKLSERWHYIHIDEYQDTNRIQYEIARILAGERKNLCVVGDVDQNIYSWRGADIAHLLSFEHTFPNAGVVMLEQNYRSTKTILAAAHNVISKNIRRKDKKLFTENETGEAIVVYGAHDEEDEAAYIAGEIRGLLGSGVSGSEIAVLYRENFQSRAIEEALIGVGIPYRIAGTRFFERKEVKDMLSYVRAALNPKASNDITRIIASPPRGIGKQTLEKMLAGEVLSGAAGAKVAAFKATLQSMRSALETQPISKALLHIAKTSGLEKSFIDGGEEGEERLRNVQELISLASRYDAVSPPEGAERLLEEAALMSDQDSLLEGASVVSLMTVHASKGLEFDAVFVTGLEQGLFPSTKGDDNRDQEEERRLFYVALTRARKHAFLTFAGRRMRYGSREYAIPSEFLEDIDARLLEEEAPRLTRGKRGILDSYEDEIR